MKPPINNQRIVELIKNGYKDIREENGMTIIEFNDGTILPLMGGGYEITDMGEVSADHVPIKPPQKLLNCSFCGNESAHVISPPNQDNPLICSNCVELAVKTFESNGIKLDINRE